jgi:hypothetical protein
MLLANATSTISNTIAINAFGGTIAAATGSTLTIGGNITTNAPRVGASGYTGTVTFGNGLTSAAFVPTLSQPVVVSFGTLRFVGSNNNWQQGGGAAATTVPRITVDNGGTVDMGGIINNYASANITLNNGIFTNSAANSTGPATTVNLAIGSLGGTVSTATGTTLTINGVVSGSGNYR